MILSPVLLAVGLVPCVAVDGDQIRAADLARSSPLFAAAPARLPVGFAPLPGAVRRFRVEELTRLAIRWGLAGAPDRDICVTRETVPLSEPALISAMQRNLPAGVEIDILEFSRFPAPTGELDFPRKGLSLPPTPDAPAYWRGAVRYASGRFFPVWAKVRLRGPCTRVFAATPLRQGEPVRLEQLRTEPFTGFPLHPQCSGPQEFDGRAPRRSLSAGALLTPALFQLPFDVHNGDKVEVEARRQGIRLRVEAVAEANGRRGDLIAVRNPASGRKFRARVDGPGRASTLPGIGEAQ